MKNTKCAFRDCVRIFIVLCYCEDLFSFSLESLKKYTYLSTSFQPLSIMKYVEAKANYLNLFQSEKKTFRVIIQPYRKLYWDVTGFLASIARGRHKEAWSLFRLIVEYLKKISNKYSRKREPASQFCKGEASKLVKITILELLGIFEHFVLANFFPSSILV